MLKGKRIRPIRYTLLHLYSLIELAFLVSPINLNAQHPSKRWTDIRSKDFNTHVKQYYDTLSWTLSIHIHNDNNETIWTYVHRPELLSDTIHRFENFYVPFINYEMNVSLGIDGYANRKTDIIFISPSHRISIDLDSRRNISDQRFLGNIDTINEKWKTTTMQYGLRFNTNILSTIRYCDASSNDYCTRTWFNEEGTPYRIDHMRPVALCDSMVSDCASIRAGNVWRGTHDGYYMLIRQEQTIFEYTSDIFRSGVLYKRISIRKDGKSRIIEFDPEERIVTDEQFN